MNVDHFGCFSIPTWIISMAIDAGVLFLIGALHATWMEITALAIRDMMILQKTALNLIDKLMLSN